MEKGGKVFLELVNSEPNWDDYNPKLEGTVGMKNMFD
jgi:hypothetical protein